MKHQNSSHTTTCSMAFYMGNNKMIVVMFSTSCFMHARVLDVNFFTK